MGRVLLYVHRNNPAIWDGKPRTATSTSTQFLSWGWGRGSSIYLTLHCHHQSGLSKH